MKITHIITGLEDGGAEHTLFKICRYDSKNKHTVISLTGKGKYFSQLTKLGIKVYCLDVKFFSFYQFYFLIKLIRFLNPDIVQTWLVHADFFGGIAARLAGIKCVVWNIRYTNFKITKTKLTTILIIKILAIISSFIPKFIIINSKRAKEIYEFTGYDKKKLKLIPNGYDLSILKISAEKKNVFRKKFNIKKKVKLIGNVARYHPKKDHLNLLKALSLISAKKKNFYCILVGSDVNKNNRKLISEIEKLNLTKHVKLLDKKDNILGVMNALDIYVQSSSYGEGFPNVVAEAMACGSPCVATNVGDASFIIGNTGWIVQPNDSLRLSEEIEEALYEMKTKEWNKKIILARERVKSKFELNKMIKSYNRLWINAYKNN